MSGVSKAPAVGTPLSITCRTPAGNTLTGVTLEVVGLRLDISSEVDASKGVKVRGQQDYMITDKEVDDTRTSPAQSGLGLAADECILNINARVPGSRMGPPRTPFAPGQDSKQIRFFKKKTDFGPKTPVVLQLTDECLVKFVVAPAILRKRVRNLTIDEAYQELVHRHKAGTIRLFPEPTFDANCVPVTPTRSLPRKRTKRGPDGNPEKVDGKEVLEDVVDAKGAPVLVPLQLVGMEPRVGAVRIMFNNFGPRGTPAAPADLINVNPINAAGLVRLVLVLARRFNITEFHHVGVARNVIINKGDCHDWGRAIDFVAVQMADPAGGAAEFRLNVSQDWAGESVPRVSELGQRPSLQPRDSAWPFVTRDLEFRFLSLNLAFDPTHPAAEQQRVVQRALNDGRVDKALKDAFNKVNANPKHTDAELEAVRAPLLARRKLFVDLARNFFQFFFDWAADNYNQSSADPDAAPQSDAPETPDAPAPATPPGPGDMGLGGRIMHADHHDTGTKGNPPVSDPSAKNGREAHNSHYHIQIGPTNGPTGAEPTLT